MGGFLWNDLYGNDDKDLNIINCLRLLNQVSLILLWLWSLFSRPGQINIQMKNQRKDIKTSTIYTFLMGWSDNVGVFSKWVDIIFIKRLYKYHKIIPLEICSLLLIQIKEILKNLSSYIRAFYGKISFVILFLLKKYFLILSLPLQHPAKFRQKDSLWNFLQPEESPCYRVSHTICQKPPNKSISLKCFASICFSYSYADIILKQTRRRNIHSRDNQKAFFPILYFFPSY